MKERLVGNTGFSVVELMIAFTIITVVLAGAVTASAASQYWRVTTDVGSDALYRTKAKLEQLRADAARDFHAASSSSLYGECETSGFCFFSNIQVNDVSFCVKSARAMYAWQIGVYPTSTIALSTTLVNTQEATALGGDCLADVPKGNWESIHTFSNTPLTGVPGDIDVLDGVAYTTSNQPPYLRVAVPDAMPCVTCVGPYAAIDAARHMRTDRVYVYAAVATSSKQLQVIDVTGHVPVMVAGQTLVGATGSYPQGSRVKAYGDRLYITTRETAGPEFFIFDISDPTTPVQLASFNAVRTITDMAVREQRVGNRIRRFVFLSAKAGLKEVAVLEVTGDTIREIGFVDLPGSADAQSITLLGNKLFVGRDAHNGPEVYVFDISYLIDNLSEHVIGTAEVGANISRMRASGLYLFLNTNKIGSEVQVWRTDTDTLSHVTDFSLSHLAEQGIDIDEKYIYALQTHDPSLYLLQSK